MVDERISVPLEHYQALTLAAKYAIDALERLEHKRQLSDDDAMLYVRLVRWSQWHEAAEERGLT